MRALRDLFGVARLRNAVGALAVATAPATFLGCSVAVNDLGGIPQDPEGCVQQPALRAATRDLTLVLASMEPHGSQKTVVSVIRRQSFMTQARVIFLPTGAGAIGPRRLELEDRPDSSDGLQCRLAEGDPLNVMWRVPQAVPPDNMNEGPYQIDFWSDLNRTGGTVEAFPADHSWSANVCDSGQFLFTHNTGFEALERPSESGTFRLTAPVDPVLRAFAHASPRIDDGLVVPREQQALFDNTLERLRQLPFVITVERQGLTVGQLVTELECVVPNDVGQVTLAIPGIVDGGNFHDVQLYFDTQRNGRFDMTCDPSCRVSVEQTEADGSLTVMLSDAAACNFPDGFHQSSPGEECAIVELPSIDGFLAGTAPPPAGGSNP